MSVTVCIQVCNNATGEVLTSFVKSFEFFNEATKFANNLRQMVKEFYIKDCNISLSASIRFDID